MKLFACDHCGNTVYFENASCERCGHKLGYRSDKNALVSLVQQGGAWASSTFPDEPYVFCQNAKHGACNWLIRAVPGGDVFCAACRHNETIPDISEPRNLARWQVIERAKKRLFYSLLRLDLPLQTRASNPGHGLSFRFLADPPLTSERVLTGHESGIITIALIEADDAEREARRTSMGEPYRTLLGHFRHEIGHHYWDLLIDGRAPLPEFRRLFGNETADYGEALQAHYAQGAPTGWSQHFISSYATSHPWEDFAETFAHYLHIVDTVEMASSFGVHARVDGQEADLSIQTGFVPYNAPDAQTIVDNWVPVASMLNNLNRAMGHPDAYPFVLTPQVIEKLSYVHQLVHRQWSLGGH